MQIPPLPGTTVVGLHVNEVRLGLGSREIVAVWEAEPKVAVIIAEAEEVMTVVLAVNAALVVAAATVTDAGTVKIPLLEERETVVAPDGALPDNAIVQVVLAFEARLDAAHCSEDSVKGACKLMVVVAEPPLRVAVMVALPFDVTVPAVAVKLAVDEFAGTDTEAGTVNAALFDDSDTVVLPLAVEFDKVTVQALVAPEVTVAGEH